MTRDERMCCLLLKVSKEEISMWIVDVHDSVDEHLNLGKSKVIDVTIHSGKK